LNTESYFIGILLRQPEISLSTVLVADDFELSREKRLFEAIKQMTRDGVVVNELSVKEHTGVSLDELLDINHINISTKVWKSAEQAIIENAKIRRIKVVAEKVLKSKVGSKDLVKMLEGIRAETLNKEVREVQDAYSFTTDSTVRYFQRKRGEGDKAISTGIRLLDDYFMGFKKRKLYYVGARPSQGKTALLLNFFANVRGKALFLSCESGTEELSDRLLVRQSRVDSKQFFKGQLDEDKEKEFEERAIAIGQEDRLFMLYDGELTVDKIRSTAYQYKKSHDIEAVFIDYLQLIKPRDLSLPRHEQVAEISRSMKYLANDLGIPVVVAVQLRREADGVMPKLRDFSDSTQIERDADVAMMLHNTTKKEGEHMVSLILIGKNRDGRTGTVPIEFQREFFHFQSLPTMIELKVMKDVEKANT
jgi:replicative DNA helicase